jgi:DNA-binding CsgD family transcriptional regulator
LRAKGLIVVQIAQPLGVGERTVYSYLKTTKA